MKIRQAKKIIYSGRGTRGTKLRAADRYQSWFDRRFRKIRAVVKDAGLDLGSDEAITKILTAFRLPNALLVSTGLTNYSCYKADQRAVTERLHFVIEKGKIDAD